MIKEVHTLTILSTHSGSEYLDEVFPGKYEGEARD
jgi:hypothetical protein